MAAMGWFPESQFLPKPTGKLTSDVQIRRSSPSLNSMHFGLVGYFIVTDQISQRHWSCMPLPERMSCSYFLIRRARVSDFLASEKCRR